jgi:hypothetical protein
LQAVATCYPQRTGYAPDFVECNKITHLGDTPSTQCLIQW